MMGVEFGFEFGSSSKKFHEKSKAIYQLRIKKDVLGYLALFLEGKLFLIYY